MKAKQLAQEHLGKRVTVVTPAWSVTGTLYRVEHGGRWVSVGQMGEAVPVREDLTEPETLLELGPFSLELAGSEDAYL